MISGFSPGALSQLHIALGGRAGSVVIIDFERLADEVAQIRSMATRIATATENPTWVAGDELCRRSATALEHEWYSECEKDSEASIQAYPYRAAPHLFKAIAQLHLGKTPAAFKSLQQSMRYGRAAEPDHAATACLLAVSLAAITGCSEEVRSLLAEGLECTAERCPEILVAASQQGASEIDHGRAVQLMLDDPSAWLTLSVDQAFFGPRGQIISTLFRNLVKAAYEVAQRAEEAFHTVKLIPAEYFGSGGALDNFGITGGRERYMLGFYIRFLLPFIESLKGGHGESIPRQVCSGHWLIRFMSRKKVSPETAHDAENLAFSLKLKDLRATTPLYLTDPAFSELTSPREINLIRPYDASPYHWSWQARHEYDSWHNETVKTFVDRVESRPSPNYSRGWWSKRKDRELSLWVHNKEQAALPYFKQFLNAAPPEVGQLHDAARAWMAETKASGDSVVKPFVSINIPGHTRNEGAL